MVLDNGDCERMGGRRSDYFHGPSGIGFVNFNGIKTIRVLSDIETDGIGARGFNVYAGSVKYAEFKRIVTHANAAVGIKSVGL